MTQMTNQFNGLGMPVFTAFGWAGEEQAISFALSQLEAFIQILQAKLPRSVQNIFSTSGLSHATNSAYLATENGVDEDIYISFFARPLSLELQLAITQKSKLVEAYKRGEKDSIIGHRLLSELGADWTLRLQQMQVDDESGEISHYQDIVKDTIDNINAETLAELLDKAKYLNSEDKWIVPLYLSRRFPSEQASAMGRAIVDVMAEHITSLMPLVELLTGRTKKKTRTKAKPKSQITAQAVEELDEVAPDDGFNFVSELKPLHIRRGFVNMTPEHWPFFATNTRMTIRPVTVYYEGLYDKKCTVWRLADSDQTRLVLSTPVQLWLENNFGANDRILLSAIRLDDDGIQISLKAVT